MTILLRPINKLRVHPTIQMRGNVATIEITASVSVRSWKVSVFDTSTSSIKAYTADNDINRNISKPL